MPAPLTFDAQTIHSAIERIASSIQSRHGENPAVCLIGIANGGLHLTRRLQTALGGQIPVGELDTPFHRDGIGSTPIPKESRPTVIPFDVADRLVILGDDVFTPDALSTLPSTNSSTTVDPAAVELAILIDRGGRKLPFAADYTGLTAQTNDRQKVVVTLDPDHPANDLVTHRGREVLSRRTALSIAFRLHYPCPGPDATS
ncbi:MAG: bifunctional pyr operon transcriptional regulator/uracil phosphoribosyltransferase PyrR [Candidatus Synoicihabitans palmerolidicus]|nr:bifunctional pyr operon transcriptional regulator/uracil phosphoribosyltransferase PyrR [Candidatus Synoicihabitans palmerolidicus]